MRIATWLSVLCIIFSCGQNKKDNKSDNPDRKQADSTNLDKPLVNQMADLTNRYTVGFASRPDSEIVSSSDFRIAVIPVDSIGKIEVPWHNMKKEFTKETEKEFQTDLMQCIDGKDKTGDGEAITIKNPTWCEREGYSDFGAMGSVPTLFYGAFVKNNNLVVAEMYVYWSKCGVGYETKKEKDDCEAGNNSRRNSLRAFMENLVKTIVITTK